MFSLVTVTKFAHLSTWLFRIALISILTSHIPAWEVLTLNVIQFSSVSPGKNQGNIVPWNMPHLPSFKSLPLHHCHMPQRTGWHNDNTCDSYLGYAEFESQLEHWLSWLFSSLTPGKCYCRTSGHNQFFPYPFQIIIHLICHPSI
jgi:hypothetical protein